MRIYYSVGWYVDRDVDAEVYRGVDDEVNIQKVDSNLWVHC